MSTTWTVGVYDFVVFSDTLTFKPAYVTTVDSLSFSDKITTNIVQATILDYITNFKDGFVVNGGSEHFLHLTDTMTFADGMMKGAPQSISDVMVLVDALETAANLILDSFAFTDTLIANHAIGLYDTIVFSDTFALSFVWGDDTAGIDDSMTFADYFNSFFAIPNPWIPNYPTTQIRSGNPTCAESSGQDGLPY